MVLGKLVIGGAIATAMIHHHDKKKAHEAAAMGAQAGQRQMQFPPTYSQSQSKQPLYRIRNSVGSVSGPDMYIRAPSEKVAQA